MKNLGYGCLKLRDLALASSRDGNRLSDRSDRIPWPTVSQAGHQGCPRRRSSTGVVIQHDHTDTVYSTRTRRSGVALSQECAKGTGDGYDQFSFGVINRMALANVTTAIRSVSP